MKKIILSAVLLLSVCVCSCAVGAKDPLWYQNMGAEISGTLRTDTGDFYIGLTLYPSEAEEYTASVRDAVIEYTYPESISGCKVTAENGRFTISSGELTLPCGETAGERFRELIKLFSIDAETLYSVENGDDGITVMYFDCDSGVRVSINSADSMPVMIESGGLKFKIDEYLPTGEATVSSEQ